jgi:uncharacterized protein (TIGR03437 family)
MPLILVIIQLQIFSRPVPLGIVLPRACSRMARIAVAFAAASLTFAQTPQFSSSGVVNAASYAQPITPGSLVSIFGTNLANATASASQLPLTTELSGTSVTVNGVKAPLLFVSPEQINLETPSTTEICYGCSDFLTASFAVTTSAGSSPTVPVPISFSAPAAFTADGSGCGPAAAQNVAEDYSVTDNSPSNSVAPGQYIAIFGTGFGLVWNGPPDGAAATGLANLQSSVGITLGVNAPFVSPGIVPNYGGLAPGLVGVDQVNFQIPADAQQGCSVPVIIGGQLNSPAVTLSIHHGGGQCVNPPVQSYGLITLTKTIASGTSYDGEADTFTATFPSGPGLPAAQAFPMLQLTPSYLANAPPPSSVPVPAVSRTCSVDGYSNLSAGPISVSSPITSVVAQPASQVGGVTYQQTLPMGFLAPGNYQISAPGGPVEFQGSLAFGSPIQIQASPLASGNTISSSRPFTVNWTGGDPGALVTVYMVAGIGLSARADYAQADASSGSLTFVPLCSGNPISAGGNGVICYFGISGTNPGEFEVIVDVTPSASDIASWSAKGVTGALQAFWDYRYIFGGLTLGN